MPRQNLTSPTLPLPTPEYNQRGKQEYDTVLRLFFNLLVNAVNDSARLPTVIKTVQVTGFSYQIPDDCTVLIINPAGVLATSTLTFPQDPVDKQILEITSVYNLTALTINTAADQTLWGWTNPSTLTAGAGLRYIYVASDATWNRIR